MHNQHPLGHITTALDLEEAKLVHAKATKPGTDLQFRHKFIAIRNNKNRSRDAQAYRFLPPGKGFADLKSQRWAKVMKARRWWLSQTKVDHCMSAPYNTPRDISGSELDKLTRTRLDMCRMLNQLIFGMVVADPDEIEDFCSWLDRGAIKVETDQTPWTAQYFVTDVPPNFKRVCVNIRILFVDSLEGQSDDNVWLRTVFYKVSTMLGAMIREVDYTIPMDSPKSITEDAIENNARKIERREEQRIRALVHAEDTWSDGHDTDDDDAATDVKAFHMGEETPEERLHRMLDARELREEFASRQHDSHESIADAMEEDDRHQTAGKTLFGRPNLHDARAHTGGKNIGDLLHHHAVGGTHQSPPSEGSDSGNAMEEDEEESEAYLETDARLQRGIAHSHEERAMQLQHDKREEKKMRTWSMLSVRMRKLRKWSVTYSSISMGSRTNGHGKRGTVAVSSNWRGRTTKSGMQWPSMLSRYRHIVWRSPNSNMPTTRGER